MKTLLRIDASARRNGSHSRELADHFQARWLDANPGGRVLTRDLAAAPVPHLDNVTIAAFHADDAAHGHGASPGAAALSDQLIAELKSADQILVSSPLYNLNLPSPLKAYIDHIVRAGHTFTTRDQGTVGLLSGKTACILTARGGRSSADAVDDFQGPYLKAVFRYIGIERTELVALEGTSDDDTVRRDALIRARAAIDHVLGVTRETAAPAGPEWIGDFTPQDRAEIDALRAAQAAAVERGDADAYARLCADDVHWLFPGHDVVAGLPKLREAQATLASRNHVQSMQKFPLRVERAGDLAVEIGRQELTPRPGSDASYPPKQKYTHLFRKTDAGWRFTVLMSNSSL